MNWKNFDDRCIIFIFIVFNYTILKRLNGQITPIPDA